jgi:hypothetical protein
MQGRSDPQRELWDAGAAVGHLLPAGSVFAFLAGHRGELFGDEMFADLFPSGRGRPSLPGEVAASVLVLQALHALSDREAAEAVMFDLRWKAACGLAVDAAGFHPTTLTYWRRRLAASGRPDRIFDAVRDVITATGAVAGKTRRALDSTILDDAVARQDTVTQLIAAVRRTGRDVPGGQELVAECCTGHDYSRPGKPAIAWDDAAVRDELVSALVRDALALLARLAPMGLDENSAAGQAAALLALVAGQDVEPAAGSDGTDGRWRIARKTAPDRVISVTDPDARHAHKTRHRRQDGYKAHVVVEPDTGLITAARLTRACGPENSDASAGIALLAEDATVSQAGGAAEVLADSAYCTGDALAALDAAGHAAVIRPRPLPAAVPGGFTIDDFTVDEAAGTATCPAGHTRPVTPARSVTFGAACRDCPLRPRCTTAAAGRTLTLLPRDALLRAHRARAAAPEFREAYRRHRPMVERSIAWLVRGCRRVPYRGVTANNSWLRLRAAAVNLRRLLALGTGPRPAVSPAAG